MDTFDQTWQCTEPLLYITWNLTQLYAQKVHFCPSCGFCANQFMRPRKNWNPLLIPHPKPIKTLNPTPARNCNSRFPPLFSAQIPNITAKKSQIPHPAKPIGDPLIRHENERSSNRRNLKTPVFRTDWKHFEKGLFRKWWRHDNHMILPCPSFPQTQIQNDRWLLRFQISSWCVFRAKTA